MLLLQIILSKWLTLRLIKIIESNYMIKSGKFPFSIVAILAILLVLASCGEYQKTLKNPDPKFKLQKAIEYYDAAKYSRAITLLTDVIPSFRGTREAETINYYYAMAHYKIGDNIIASHYFKAFANSFPLNEHAEEFLFLAAYTKYLDSPRISLDQTATTDAIKEFQVFTNRFPGSNKVVEANKLIDELRLKLEQKIFDQALLYINIGDYLGAITTFNNLIVDYPGSMYLEESYFQIVRAYSEFANQSIRERQEERFKKVVESHKELLKVFPETRFKSRSESLLKNATNQLELFN
jgi:outer membrane protein assembly factor BamD